MADVHSQLEGKVSSNHSAAQTAIEELRGIAVMVKRLGDENLALREERDSLQEAMALDGNEAELLRGQVEHWTDLLEDFKRGVRDRDEVLAGTVGA